MKYFIFALGTFSLVACLSVSEHPSMIVKKAETCGLGLASDASPVAMQDWFARHRDCAVAVDDLCRPPREAGNANWTDSTEGRVCLAARSVAQWIRRPSGAAQ